MIELVSIEVENFRSFSHAILSPLGIGQGMTAINGANGSGKSSIATHALVWALYGQTPEGVNVKGLRRQGSEGEVRASVTFKHDGQIIMVSRSLRGRNDTTSAAISVNGIEQTNVSSKTATAWVEERLGIDAEAFTTAFVIRQKEVDGLVRARPAERRALVERLAGIDKMSGALKASREEARHLSSVASAYSETVDVAGAEKRAEECAGEAERLRQVAAEYEGKEQAARADVVVKEKALSEAETLQGAFLKHEHAYTLAEQFTRTAEVDVARARSAAVGSELLPDAQAAAADTQEARAEAERVIASVADAVKVAQHLADAADAALKEADDAKVEEGILVKRANTLAAEYETYPADISDMVLAAQGSLEESTNLLASASSERDRIMRAVEALEIASHAGQAECPTCASSLSDASGLLQQMREDLVELENKVASLRNQVKENRDNVASLQRTAEARAAKKVAWDVAKAEATTAERDTIQAYARAHKVEEDAEDAAEIAHASSSAAEESAAELPALREAELNAQKALRKAETAEEANSLIPDLESAAEDARGKLEQAEEALEKARLAAEEVDVVSAKTAAEEARAKVLSAVSKASDASLAASLAERDASTAQAEAVQAQLYAETRKQALAAAEVGHAVSSALEEFRRDRIARLAPELSEVASDVVAIMTDGKYTTVELDEDFTPILTEAATGLQRPTAWLSGGEESAVSLALRIAIGEVVSGQHAGLLVLDEVLTAQDPARRASVMSAIRALNARQVITINHVSEATDMVDLVTYVVPSANGGSTLELSAEDSGSDRVVSEENLDEDG